MSAVSAGIVWDHCVDVHIDIRIIMCMYNQSLRLGKAKQLHPTITSFEKWSYLKQDLSPQHSSY